MSREFTPGAKFILSAPDHVPALWGAGDEVLWAAGEPMVLAGPPGVGKTTVAQQLALARCGGSPNVDVLGMPVEVECERYTAYIAADRPRQAARSMRRMVKPVQHPLLTSLLVWEGPLPFSITAQPGELAGWLRLHQVGTVVIDSLKDVAVGLADDQVGAAVGQALQHVVAAGIEVAVLHHQRKGQDGNRKPRSLDDVYGSAWITAGAGSVVLLWGQAGDTVVELRHLKQPAGEVGPLEVVHDHLAGTSTVSERPTVRRIVRAATGGGVTVSEVAQRLSDTESLSRDQIEKTRRKLEALVAEGAAMKVPGDAPKAPARYRPVDRGRDALESQNSPKRDSRDTAVIDHGSDHALSRSGSVEHHAPITADHAPRSEGTTPVGGAPTVNGNRTPTCSCSHPAPSPRAAGPAECVICRRPMLEAVA